jgi:hypothetical protein
MSEHEQQVTPTLAETARRRADLHHALVEVEKTISSPAVGREADWAKDVAVALESLRATIDEHIEVTERPEGLYDEIAHRAPRLASKIERLKDEHPSMRDGTTELIARLESTPIGDA